MSVYSLGGNFYSIYGELSLLGCGLNFLLLQISVESNVLILTQFLAIKKMIQNDQFKESGH